MAKKLAISSVVLIIIISVIIAGAWHIMYANTSSAHEDVPFIESTVVLGNLSQPFSQPDIYKNSMVWVGDLPNTPLHNPDSVFLMDIGTKKVQRIAATSFRVNPVVTDPQIDQHWITWLDEGEDNNKPTYRLFAMNRSNKVVKLVSTFPASTGKSFYMDWINLTGDELIWSEPNGENSSDLRLIDLRTGTFNNLTVIHSDLAPAISRFGNMLVWEREDSILHGSIIIFDLPNKKVIKSIPVSGRFAYPEIYSQYILYSPEEFKKITLQSSGEKTKQELINLRTTLKIYDLDHNSSLSIQANMAYFWRIGNGFIAWSDYSKGHSMVFVEGITNHKRITVGHGFLPYIFGNRIIWLGSNQKVVYLSTIKI